jgi:hypothetical protein
MIMMLNPIRLTRLIDLFPNVPDFVLLAQDLFD